MVGIFSLLWRNKFLIMLFSYTVLPTAMKFGMITGIGAQHVLAHLGELWRTGAPLASVYAHRTWEKKKRWDSDLCISHLGNKFAARLGGAVRIGGGGVA